MNDGVQSHLAMENSLESLPGAIRDNLVYTFPFLFRTPKTGILPPNSPSSVPPNSPRSKVCFIHLNLARKGRLTFTVFCQSLYNALRIWFMLSLFTPESSSIFAASKSMAKYHMICPHFLR
jgi:hypothetical protein